MTICVIKRCNLRKSKINYIYFSGRKIPAMANPDTNSGSTLSVRIKVLLLALFLWLALSLPSIIMTIVLANSSTTTDERQNNNHNNDSNNNNNNKTEEVGKDEDDFACYENFTVYHPVFETAQFWIEGVLLIGVGIFGICGNCLTLVVLSKSKNSSFHQVKKHS
jgi:hypothetical protein